MSMLEFGLCSPLLTKCAEKLWPVCALKSQQVMSPSTEEMEMRRRRMQQEQQEVRQNGVQAERLEESEAVGLEMVPVAEVVTEAEAMQRIFGTPEVGRRDISDQVLARSSDRDQELRRC